MFIITFNFSENVCYYFMVGFHWSLYSDTLFIWYGEKQTPNNNYLLELISKEYQEFKRRILTNEKNFPKTISQSEFNYGMFTNLPKIIIAYNFSPSSFKLRSGILPLLTK